LLKIQPRFFTKKPMNMKKLCLFFALLFLVSHLAFGQVPRLISYQGVLTESDGSAVSDGNYSMTFSLYTAATGGMSSWQEAKTVLVVNGIFNVNLGDVTPLNLDFKNPYWLGVTVGAASEMTPRVELTASAYSLNANAVGGFEASASPAAGKLLSLGAGGKFPASAIPGRTSIGGTSSSSNISITGTSFVEILSFTVNQSGTYDVKLDASLVGEINGDGNGRYEFRISKGSVGGTQIARAWWRPGAAAGFQALTFSLTGVDEDVSGPQTYYLVARKFDGGAKDMLVFISALDAIWVAE
jgi:hypothetical protein